jgi:hypothetical protein
MTEENIEDWVYLADGDTEHPLFGCTCNNLDHSDYDERCPANGFPITEVVPEGTTIVFACWECGTISNDDVGHSIGYCSIECFEEEQKEEEENE